MATLNGLIISNHKHFQMLTPTARIAYFTRLAFVIIVRVVRIGLRLTQSTTCVSLTCAVIQDSVTCNTHKYIHLRTSYYLYYYF